MATRLGQLLTSSKMITEDQLNEAIGLQRREGGRLGTNLIKLGYITEEKLVSFLSKQWGVPAVTLSDYMVDSLVLKLIPYEIARKYLIVPLARVGATLTIAMADPSNVFVIDDVKFMTGFNVEVVVAGESSV
ncbi:MAG: type II secretion system protein GspE, partial [Thermodesulfovibrionales bacterium]